MSKDLFFIGEPTEFKLGVFVYPPTIRQVASNIRYATYTRILTYSHEEIEDIYVKEKKDLTHFPTPLEFLMNNSYHSPEYEVLAKQAFKFFLHKDVEFLYEQKLIVVGKFDEVLSGISSLQDLVTISEEEFFNFQNLIREACTIKPVEPPDPNQHPKIKAMKAKARYRDKIKAKQAAKNGMTLFSTLTSICCMGVGLNPLNIGEMSYVAMDAIISMYQNKEKYQLDIDSLLAGADSKKVKPKYWIRNLEE